VSTEYRRFQSARRCTSAGTSHDPVSVSVLSKGMNGLVWFVARGLLSTSPALCSKEIQAPTEIMVLLELCPKLRTCKVLRRNVLSTSFEKGGRSERDKLAVVGQLS